MFTTIKFRNFKSLRDFTIHLKPINVLVGPNNAGKSTILDAFRALVPALSFASRRVPTLLQIGSESVSGYDVPVSHFPITLANIHSDYLTDEETSVIFTLSNGNKLKLSFYDNSRCILTLDETGKQTRSTKQFKSNFPISLYSFPTLGPLEEEELLLTDEYVRQFQNSRRSHRMFRNIWYRKSAEFPAFQSLVEQTWEGMSISKSELDMTYPPQLTMFCKEGRVDRELCWAGFGFQIWLQLLTHLLGAGSANVLIVDEPEIYLHPDLQHRLFHLLKASDKQIILATHSAEIVNEAEHDDIILINRSKKTGRRIGDIEGLQEALFSIGSGQNIHLARLSRGKKILFLEGNDFRLIRRLAARLGYTDLADNINITVIPIGGFSQRQRIENAAWTFEKVLRAEISIAALLDRDYRCPEEIKELTDGVRKTIPHFHILEGKEIENYLLNSTAITRAICDRLKDRGRSQVEIEIISVEHTEHLMMTLTDDMKSDVLSQIISNRMRYFSNRTSKDPATVAAEAIVNLDSSWADLRGRLMVVPGKHFLASLNGLLQSRFGISVTPPQIIRHITPGEIDPIFRSILEDLNRFAVD